MPKTPITAKFIRVPVEGGRLPVAPAFDDFLDAKHMVVVELGMQKGHLLPEYFDAEKSAKKMCIRDRCRIFLSFAATRRS